MSDAATQLVFEPWAKGTRFLIRNSTIGGKSCVEGKATIHNPVDPSNNVYEVEFDDEPGALYQRRVEGGDMLVN